jgi:nuclear protein localization family protein 4
LQSQEYRMVDHVEFAHPQLIENLLSFWRSTGTQRYGFLLGHYEPYDVVPMGIKAVVEAIHEPPQEGEVDGVTLGVPWEDQARVESLAAACGLSIVGQIYTDLTPADPTFSDPEKAGKVLCKRHKDSFFLSSLEAQFAGQLQAANANPCKYSLSGKYGSKFVTCVLSGTEEGAIDVSAYQISEQGVGMVKSDMIEASVQPSTVRVKPASATRYVPEVFYRYKNEYKIEVKESAKPTFPVEYLLVTLTHGFPNTPNPRFLATTTPFPIENRPGLHDQSAEKLYSVLANGALSSTKLLTSLSDWHLLSFLHSQDLLEKEDLESLCQIAAGSHSEEAMQAVVARPAVQNLLSLAEAHTEGSRGGQSVGGGGGGSVSEPMGDYAADDYIPPEAMEGYQAPQASTAPPPAPVPAQTRAPPADRSTADEPDEFTYTGEDDEGMAYDDDDDDEGAGADDGAGYGSDMFDDASSTLSAENGLQAASISGRPSGVGGGGGASSASRSAPPPPPTAAASVIACPHCTFENAPGSRDCDVCGLPLSG